ncbi:ParA family protein [Geminicoccaceae bacterium 1502E]|nr:ParA family protein [Geminicoccaceae bacterium 1502E]
MAAGAARGGQIVAVGNLKGGTGKSTLAVNLACAMASSGREVVLIDADPQGTALIWAAAGRLPVRVEPLVAAHLGEVGRWMQRLELLRRRHALVVLDLPSVMAPALATACLVASLVLVPSASSFVDVAGTRRMLRHIETARRERPHRPPAVLLVPSRVIDFDAGFAALESGLAALGEPVGPPLRLRAAHEQAFRSGRWVGDLAPGSAAHLDVMGVADAALELLEQAARRPAAMPAARAPEPAPAMEERIAAAHREALSLGGRPASETWWRRLVPTRLKVA